MKAYKRLTYKEIFPDFIKLRSIIFTGQYGKKYIFEFRKMRYEIQNKIA